jgi:hypothetical protein
MEYIGKKLNFKKFKFEIIHIKNVNKTEMFIFKKIVSQVEIREKYI